MKRAFVTGGSGFLGGRLIEVLTASGIDVTALARSSSAASKVRALGARVAYGDTSQVHNFLDELHGSDVLFHSAAYLHFWGDLSEFIAANLDATLGVIDAASRAGVKRVVLISAASVVMREPAPLANVDESAPLTDRGFLPYSATKAMAEATGLARTSASTEVVAVRPPMIWGPGDAFDRELGERIKAGRFAYLDGGRFPYAVCHVDNVCHGAILAARRGRAGQSYFLADAEVTDARVFLDARIRAAGLKPPAVSVPSPLAWVLAGGLEAVWRTFRLKSDPPLTREMVRLMGYEFTINLEKSKVELGYTPVVSRDDGLSALNVKTESSQQ